MSTATQSWWRTFLPEGRGLAPDVWQRRHGILSGVLLAHVPVLYIFGVVQGESPLHVAWEVALLAAAALVSQWPRLPRTLREIGIAGGLLASSALLVHLSGGYIEAHFHFFVMLPLVAMYQRWVPFITAVVFVLVHHGVVGVLDASSVYNHPAALAQPWTWAGIHALFVALECLTLFRLWREVEDQQAAADAANLQAAQLLDVQMAKERLLRVASHELSTPLTPIKLHLRMLADPRAPPGRQQESMDVLQRNFTRLERIVGSVLDAVRLNNDAIRLERREQDVSAVVAAAASAYSEVAEQEGIALQVDAKPVIAHIDAERIGQVADNLLSNAIKYTPRGGTVVARVRDEGARCRIEVQDSGAGMDADQIARLFQPFSMVHGSQETQQGTGLGLFICKGIIEGHGGQVGVSSGGPGQGSLFWAAIPKHPTSA